MSTDNLQQALANAAAAVRSVHPELGASDLEFAYERFRRHFAEREDDPPVSDRPAMDELLLALWDVIVDRETEHVDDVPGDLEDYYVLAFTALLGEEPTLVRDDEPIAFTEELNDSDATPAEVAPTPGEDGLPASNIEGEMSEPDGGIYRLYILLDGSQPEIWRRILVPHHVRQGQLHHYIQAVMGWRGSENYQFFPPATSVPKGTGEPTLQDLFPTVGEHCGYEFDTWYHDLKLEAIEPARGNRRYPVCTAGERACPPQDEVSGMKEYNEMLEALNDSSHPDHREIAGWITQDFNPGAFNIDQANVRLGKVGDVGFQAVK
ncbi:plasmid pRiA4b ORF-3 family protein [Lewinella sp. IMCC34183]|uniref:plasmid pRiA4b ORF-3 family protein n=1 Tax=Lewinella sp. IMCC34183 TaxID=2248762 RepID=UPI000E23C18E|nr:plasmid pRiA4b ORF-3 family protein [Lewinella sp. IMCC34183]